MRKYADTLGELMGFKCKGPYWFKSNPKGANANIKPKLDTMNEIDLEGFKNQVKLLQPRERNWNDIALWKRIVFTYRLSYKEKTMLSDFLKEAESAYRIYEINSETKTLNKSFSFEILPAYTK